MERKAVLLKMLAQTQVALDDFVAGLTDQERSRQGTFTTWSAKDVLAHITAWEVRLAGNIRVVSQGRTPLRTGDLDQENARFYREYQGKSWQEILAEEARAHGYLVEQVQSLDEDTLDSQGGANWQTEYPVWRVLSGNAFSHPLAHLSGYYREQGQFQKAAEMVRHMARLQLALDDGPEWQGVVHYNLACHAALQDHKAEAIGELRQALELNPGLKDWSQEDADLDALRDEPDFLALFR